MYIFKNALRNINRAKGRSFLIFTLILVISISACISLSIKESAEQAKETAYDNMSITGSISIDRELMMSQVQEGSSDREAMMGLMQQSLSLEEMEVYAASEYVDNFYYTASVGLSAEEDVFEVYESDEISVATQSPESMGGGGRGQGSGSMGGGASQNVSSDFTIIGYSSHDAMTDFTSGIITILEGSVFDIEDNTNQVVISEEIAYLNDLEVGSTFTLLNPMAEFADATEEISFTVAGIFTCTSTDGYANYMYISYDSLEAIMEVSESVATTFENERSGEETSTAITTSASATYVFANVDTYEAFDTDLEGMGLDTSLYSLQSQDIEAFESSIVPLENLSSFTMMFFLVVLAVGGIILVIFNLFAVRERKYEIGVLAAIGMQKPKVAMQFILETVLITFTAIIIGSGIGAVASQPIADNLLASQIESIATESASVNDNFGGGFSGQGGGRGEMSMPGQSTPTGNAAVDYVDSVVAGLNVEIFLQLIAMGMFLAVLASSVGLITILRYEPLKILSSRS